MKWTAGEIRAAVDHALRRRAPYERDWLENVEMLKGDFSRTGVTQFDRVDVNMVWGAMRAVIPSLYYQNPDVIAIPRRPQDANNAPVMEGALRYWIPEMGTQRVVERSIVDANCFPYSVSKLGFKTKDVEVAVSISKRTGEITVVDESEEVDLSEVDVQSRVIQQGERPTLARLSPLAVVWDGYADDHSNAEWVAHVIPRRIRDLVDDPKYRNVKRLAAGLGERYRAANSHGPRRHDMGDLGESDFGESQLSAMPRDGAVSAPVSDEAWVHVIEFWDKVDHKLYVTTREVDVMMREQEWPYPFLPFFFMELGVPIPDHPLITPPISIWKPQQKELNKIRSYQLDHIKWAISRYFADRGKLGKEQQDALAAGAAVILVDGSPENVVVEIPGAQMNPEVGRAEAAVKMDIQQITGLADFARAAVAPAGTTATENRLIAGAMSAMIAWQRNRVAKLVEWVGTGAKDLLKLFWDKPQMIRISGRANFEWRPLTREQLEGDYDVTVKAGSQVQMDDEVRKKQASDQFSILAPIALQTGKINFDELLRWFMTEMRVPDPDRFLQTDESERPPTPAEDEEVLLDQGGSPVMSVNDDHPNHILMHYQGVMKAQDEGRRWRGLLHLRKHLDLEDQRKMAMAMMAAGPMAAPGAVPGQPPQLTQGQGRRAPEPGYPINPRQFNAGVPSETSLARTDSRRVG